MTDALPDNYLDQLNEKSEERISIQLAFNHLLNKLKEQPTNKEILNQAFSYYVAGYALGLNRLNAVILYGGTVDKDAAHETRCLLNDEAQDVWNKVVEPLLEGEIETD